MPRAGEYSRSDPHQRILDASYDLFVDRGVRAVGINEIIKVAGVAKASFYSYFPSKNDLILAFLDRRRSIFTIGYLGAESQKRSTSHEEQLFTIFDIFEEWFQAPDFTGCPYIRALVEAGPEHEVGEASAGYLREMRDEVQEAAKAMNLINPREFADCWMILLQGSVIAALATGYAPDRVKQMGRMLMASHTRS